MLISELIKLLEQQQNLYGDNEVKIRDHTSGIRHQVDYVTFWTKEKECQIGILNNIVKDK
jgi:hypothetical protein